MAVHTVMAMIGNLPKKVQCAICGSQHNFRLPPSDKPARAPRRGAASRKPPRGGWKTVLAGVEGSSPTRRYELAERFSVNDIVEHPSFGTGVVRNVMPGDKIEVLFEGGSKILAHAR